VLRGVGDSDGGAGARAFVGACPCVNLSKICLGLNGIRPAPRQALRILFLVYVAVRATMGIGKKLPFITATIPNRTRRSTCIP